MSDQRDKYPRKPTPVGIQAQIAGPEDLSSYTPTHPTPVEQPVIDESTMHRIERHGAENKNLATVTLSGIDALRHETNTKFEKVHEKIDAQAEVLSDVRAMAAESVGQNTALLRQQDQQNTIMLKLLDQHGKAREQSGEMHMIKETTTLEIGKHRALSEAEVAKANAMALIEDTKADKAVRREVLKTAALKLIAGAGIAATAVLAVIQAGGC